MSHADTTPPESPPPRGRTAADLILPRHRRVAKMVGYALALTGPEGIAAYMKLARIIRDALPPEERRYLAYAALGACDPTEAQAIVDALFEIRDDGRHGPPDGFWTEQPIEEATWWAGIASDIERRAYAFACLAMIEESERETIVAALKGRRAP